MVAIAVVLASLPLRAIHGVDSRLRLTLRAFLLPLVGSMT